MTTPRAKEKGCLEKIVEHFVEKAVDAFTGPVLDYTKDFCGKAAVFLGDYDENVKKLEMGLEGLTSTRDSLQASVENESRYHSTNMKASGKVNEWYGQAKRTAVEAGDLIEKGKREEDRKCLGKCCFGRFLYGKHVVKCWERLSELKETGDKLMDDKGGLLEAGQPDEHDRRSDFESTCRELRNAIIRIEHLRDEVKDILGQNPAGYGGYEVRSWLKEVELELVEGKSLTSEREKYLAKIESLGHGSSSADQRKISSCTARIVKYYGVGVIHWNALTAAAGPSYRGNEIAPLPE